MSCECVCVCVWGREGRVHCVIHARPEMVGTTARYLRSYAVAAQCGRQVAPRRHAGF